MFSLKKITVLSIIIVLSMLNFCSDLDKNPFEPDAKTEAKNLQIISNKKATLMQELPSSNSKSQADTSYSGVQSLAGGTIFLYYFNGIYDVTEVGGFPSMRFDAWSQARDPYGILIRIQAIGAEAWARWKYTNESSFKSLWHDSDQKSDEWQAEVQSPVFYKKSPWTAISRSKHHYAMYPEQGGQVGDVYTYWIGHTAYFLENKANN